MISPILSMMPLIQHTDGNRIAMSSSHHKQSQILSQDGINVSAETPLIRTTFSDTFSKSSKFFIKRATGPGVVKIVDNILIIEYDNGSLDIINTSLSIFYDILVKNNQRVKRGQIIMKHKTYSEDTTIRYGVHLNAMFGDLKGTFEDAIVISESAAKKLTSYSIETKDIIITRKVFDVNYEALSSKFVRKGDWIVKEYKKPISLLSSPVNIIHAEHDMEILGIYYQEFDNKLKYSQNVKKFLKEYSVDVEFEKIKKVVNPKNANRIKKEIMAQEDGYAILRIIYKTVHRTKVGDKLVNRYGNKGVISKILPDDELVKMFPFNDEVDFKPEIVFNALGIHTRMNPSQLGELHLNYILKYIIPQYIILLKQKGYSSYDILKFIVNQVHMKLHKKYGEKINQAISQLSDSQQDFIIKDILQNGLQIELPIFCDDDKGYLLKIYEIVKTLAPKYFDQIKYFGYGVFYIMKLEHMVEKKINAISTSKYSSKFQPIDGQRIGEMEMWDIFAYDAPATLYSVQKVKSDEPNSKMIAYEKIVNNGRVSIDEIPDSEPSSKRLFESLLKIVNIDMNLI